MKTARIEIDIPETVLIGLNETAQAFGGEVRLLVALELYKRGRLSLGTAAEVADLPVAVFIFEAGKHNIPIIDYEEQDFRDELVRFSLL